MTDREFLHQFRRGGELLVSQVSAWLMGIFLVTLGVACGLFAGSFLQDRRKSIAVVMPSLLAVRAYHIAWDGMTIST